MDNWILLDNNDKLKDNKDIYMENIKNLKRISIDIKNLKNISSLEEPFIIELNNTINLIVGENGTGKSSLLISIGQLLNHNSIKNEFKGKYYENSEITYLLNKTIIYKYRKRNPETNKNEWTLVTKNEIQKNMLKIRGFFESSILSGTRFNNLKLKDKIINYCENNDIQEIKLKYDKVISSYFKEIMDKEVEIYKYNFEYYKKSKQEVFCFKIDENKYIPEFLLSTGEYFILNLLKFILKYLDKKENCLIVIDEVDMALHPKAQKNLIKVLKKFTNKNITFIIATHSLPIIYEADGNNIVYIENNNGNLSFIKNKKGGYISSFLDNQVFYDRVFLVEDLLALKFIKQMISIYEDLRKESLNTLYQIIPIGGWNEVINFAKYNYQQHILNSNKIFVILDGDIKDDEKFKERKENSEFFSLNLGFLPILSVEKYIKEIFQKSSFKHFIKNEYLGIDNYDEFFKSILHLSNNKSIFKEMKKLLNKYKNISEEKFENDIIKYIIETNKEEMDFENFKNRIKNFLIN